MAAWSLFTELHNARKAMVLILMKSVKGEKYIGDPRDLHGKKCVG
jgi:hypothetical protein